MLERAAHAPQWQDVGGVRLTSDYQSTLSALLTLRHLTAMELHLDGCAVESFDFLAWVSPLCTFKLCISFPDGARDSLLSDASGCCSCFTKLELKNVPLTTAQLVPLALSYPV
jgi:hypothetical protein